MKKYFWLKFSEPLSVRVRQVQVFLFLKYSYPLLSYNMTKVEKFHNSLSDMSILSYGHLKIHIQQTLEKQ